MNHPDFMGGSRALTALSGGGYGGDPQNAYPPAPPQAPLQGQRRESQPPPKREEPAPVAYENGFFSFFKQNNVNKNRHMGQIEGIPGKDSTNIRLPQVPATVTPGALPSDRERIEIDIIKSLVTSYFNIVRKSFVD